MRIVVIGGYGEMGSVITTDLSETARETEIVVTGRDEERAKKFAASFKKKHITGAGADVTNKKDMAKVLDGADVVINATNYYNNVNVMEMALSARANYVDLGGLYRTTLKQLKLHGKFYKKNLVAVIGCGSTPGITNIMAHWGSHRLDSIDSIDIQFGDRDFTKYDMPFVVPYSMYTVFDEFMEKPAVLENGRIKFVEPLSGDKTVVFPKPVGAVRCRYSLHSELATLPATFKSKGIKRCTFRGGWDNDFVAKVKFLIDAGFASKKPFKVDGGSVIPRDFSVKMLNRFLPPRGTEIDDYELLRVELRGKKNGSPSKVVVLAKAVTNRKWNIPAGSWDTGVPPSVVAQMIARGETNGVGVLPPDTSVMNPNAFFREIKKRGIKVYFERNEEIA